MQIVVVNHSVKAAHCNDSSDEAEMSQWQKFHCNHLTEVKKDTTCLNVSELRSICFCHQ